LVAGAKVTGERVSWLRPATEAWNEAWNDAECEKGNEIWE